MAAIVLAGSPPIPVRYESWDEWRADVTQPLPAPLIAARTASCPRCWGQGRVIAGFAQAASAPRPSA